jgi:membrane carboxypeptidase/penicillin-binding protein
MDFWSEIMKDKPVEDFAVPGNIVFVPVDRDGYAGQPGDPGVRMEPFIAGTEPRGSAPSSADLMP